MLNTIHTPTPKGKKKNLKKNKKFNMQWVTQSKTPKNPFSP